MKLHQKYSCLLILFAAVVLTGCSDKKTIVGPGPGDQNYWENYIGVTLPNGFKLVSLSGEQREADFLTTSYQGMVLNFAIDPEYRSNLGYIFRGNDQGDSGKENLCGAVELVKQSGWLRHRETFDWEGLKEDPPGSFKFTRINRYTQFPIRTTFSGYAYDLMLTLLSEPYIGYPTDTTKTWSGPVVNVSDGSQSFIEIISYRIHYLGDCDLMENSSVLASYSDVIHIEGAADQGQGAIDAYLAPNVGIIYYHLTTAFGQEGAGALIGFSGDNEGINGGAVTDYFPTSPGNNWIYEFAPDDHVPQFRFSVKQK
jgi:hypothetical protein